MAQPEIDCRSQLGIPQRLAHHACLLLLRSTFGSNASEYVSEWSLIVKA